MFGNRCIRFLVIISLVLFHLWWKGIAFKCEKVYKCFVQDCSITDFVYEIPNRLPNYLRFRMSGNIKNWENLKTGSGQNLASNVFPEMAFENSGQKLLKYRYRLLIFLPNFASFFSIYAKYFINRVPWKTSIGPQSEIFVS